MSNPLQKILDLIKTTGDNCIVLDAQGNPNYVVMGFDRYQKLLETGPMVGKGSVIGLTENELLNKINNDIATWKASVGQDNLDFASLVTVMDGETPTKMDKNDSFDTPVYSEKSLNQAKKEETSGKTEEKYYFEPID